MGGTEPLQKQPYLFQPVATLTSFSFAEVVEEVRATHFPQLERSVEVRVSIGEALASCHCDFMGQGEHMVRFHPILNHPETPLPVVRFVAKHELTHALMPWANHTPEFWQLGAAISPERYAVRLPWRTCWGVRKGDGNLHRLSVEPHETDNLDSGRAWPDCRKLDADRFRIG